MRHAPKLCLIGIGDKPESALVDHVAVGQENSMPKRVINPETQSFQRMVGKRLSWVRNVSDHTQTVTSRLIGVSQPTYSKWESGERMPDPLSLLRFCARYRVSMGYIYQGSMLEVHPALAKLLMQAHPELRETTNGMVQDTGTLRAEYKAAIGHLPKL